MKLQKEINENEILVQYGWKLYAIWKKKMTIETHFWATNGDNKNSPLTMARQPSRQKLESSFSLPQEVQSRRNQVGVKDRFFFRK